MNEGEYTCGGVGDFLRVYHRRNPGTVLAVNRDHINARLVAALLCSAALIAGCAAFPAPVCKASDSVRVYQAANIGEQWIDFVWLEIPSPAAEGTFPGRLFVASADPVGAIVPTMIDLPCQPSGSAVDFAPASVELTIDRDGLLKTSYPWKSCAACSECYMQWTFSLDVQGKVDQAVLLADLVLNETFHSAPMQILSLKMPEVTQACSEPHLSCQPGGECGRIRFKPRQ